MLKRWLTIIAFALLLFSVQGPALAQETSDAEILILTADGALTPALLEYLSRGIEVAEKNEAEAIVLYLNTPGGGVDLMQEIVAAIRASRVPIIVYVAPRGAIAGSAGTVITLAGHAAAMAPETAIGAASPVGSQGEDIGETMEAKLKEVLKAQVRSLASHRGEDAVKLAEDTIESAKAVSAQEALDAGLVDLIADDLDHLLDQLDGMEVETLMGTQTLDTEGVSAIPLDPSFIEQILAILTNPNVVFILLSIGVQAILIEISNPGGWVAGFVGVVSLALAVYGLGVLPVNWFGIIFLVLAFILFILDLKAPTHGALTTAGIGSLIVSALVLFNSPATPEFSRVSVPLVIVSSLFTGTLFAIALAFAVRAQRSPIRTGHESMVGRTGVVRESIPPLGAGKVQLGGELWTAELLDGSETIEAGSRVEVVSVQGLRLKVRKVTPNT